MGEVIRLRVASSDEAIILKSSSGTLVVEAISPRVSFEKVGGGTRLDITDIDGTKSAILPDGAAGPTGPAGETGPQGPKGDKGDKGPQGNDYVLTTQDKVDIAKLVDISSKADKASNAKSGNLASLDANGNLTDSGKKASDFLTEHQAIPVTDVRVNGTSVLANGVGNVPIASATIHGAVRVGDGLTTVSDRLCLLKAGDDQVKAGIASYRPIVPGIQHQSAFYGLAKAAGDTTQSSSSNAVGSYTSSAVDKILAMLGVSNLIAPRESTAIASKAYSIGKAFIYSGKLYKATAPIASGDAIVPGTNCITTYLVDLI